MAFFTTGLGLSSVSQSSGACSFFENPSMNKAAFYKVRLEDEIGTKSNSWRCKTKVLERVDSLGKTQRAMGYLLVYWPKRFNKAIPNLHYGDEIWIPNHVIAMPSAAFPGDFDFKAVMRYKDVQHQIFLKGHNWRFQGNSGLWIRKLGFRIRNVLLAQLRGVFEKNDAAFLSSLILGYRQEMGTEQLQQFSATGTMHILAVSGLHVGLIYAILVFLFTRKKSIQRLPWLPATIVICSLWLFALITGFAPSVVRAVFMFTLVEAGRSYFFRSGNLLNSLFAAAFVQLLINPLNLIDTGFQLSYLAVIGIGLIYPKLTDWISPENRILRFIWNLTALSMSATVATLPATLYYFHSFPLWFIPANILAVPLAGIILQLALLALVVANIPLISIGIVWCIHKLIAILNGGISILGNLPVAKISDIFLSDIELLLISLFLCVSIFALYQNGRVIYVMLICLGVGVCASLSWRSRTNESISRLVVCELRNKALVAWHHGPNMDVYSTPISQQQSDALYGFMRNYCLIHQIQRVSWHMTQKPYIQFSEIVGETFGKNGGIVLRGSKFPNIPLNSKVYCRKSDSFNIKLYSNSLQLLQNNFHIIEL